LYPQVNPETLVRIGKLVLYLEGKGRSKSTQVGYEKNLCYLAQRADLNNTEEVDLAIARYVKKDGRPDSNNYKENYVTAMQDSANFTK
jgi:hypothetical protein